MRTIGTVLVVFGVAVFCSFALRLVEDEPDRPASVSIRRSGVALGGIVLTSGLLMVAAAGKDPDRRGGGPPLNPV
jgi:hypothetical protein